MMINRRFVSSVALIALISNSGFAAGMSFPTTGSPDGVPVEYPSGSPTPNGSPSSGEGISPSGPQSFTLESLKYENAGAAARVVVESSAPPVYTVLRPTEQLIVIDMPGADGSKLSPEYSVKSELVDSITVRGGASHERNSAGKAGSVGSEGTSHSDGAATRIELKVRRSLRDRSSLRGNSLVLELLPEGSGSSDPVAAKPHPAEPGVYVYPVAMKTDTNSTPVSAKSESRPAAGVPVKADNHAAGASVLKPAKLLNSVRTQTSGSAVRILIEADGLAQYKDFTLANPSRIVVDVEGVHSAFGNKTIQVGAASVEKVRIGQPSSGVVRIVLDSTGKVPYNVTRDGALLIITVGDEGKFTSDAAPAVNSPGPAASEPHTQSGPGVRQEQARVTTSSNAPEQSKAPSGPAPTSAGGAKSDTQSENARGKAGSSQTNTGNASPAPQGSPLKNASFSKPAENNAAQPKAGSEQKETASSQVRGQAPARQRKVIALCDPDYVGGPISFDLRSGVDIRDMLRFISQQYGVNFIVDKSVAAVPVEMTINDVPWNQVVDSVMRANRLGWVCESEGRILRIATLTAIKDEEAEKLAIKEQQEKAKPLETAIRHLRYARAAGSLGATGGGRSGGGGGMSGGGFGGGGGGGLANSANAGGGANRIGLLQIANSRLSPRGHIDVDNRTNSLIITDLPDNVRSIQAIIDQLDKPEAQVEIEARIIVADRNFLRDIGVQLGAQAANVHRGALGVLETSPITVVPGRTLSQGGQNGSSGGGGGTSGGSGGTGGNGSNAVGPNLPFVPANNALGAAANTVLGLTTGVFGTNLLSMALSASETKGQIRTIASPRITAQDNQTAEIVNGVQIPVQTVSNNTVTTTFITAALRLEITPQIVEETGEVSMHVVAENNTVNSSLANQFNGGTPGINTQSAESIVRVQDGGTTVMGGINIEQEGSTVNRTPGVSRLPLIGELFKRRTINRDSNEVLFFITPRIVRKDASGALAPQRSSADPPADKGRPDAAPKSQPGDPKALIPAVAVASPAPARTQDRPTTDERFAAYVGLNTTDDKKIKGYSVCLQVVGSGATEAYQIKDQPESLSQWIAGLRERFKGGKVAVAIPQSEAAAMEALLHNNNFLVLYPVDGNDLGRFRQAFSANQVKSAATDAAVLKGIASMYRDKLKPMYAEDQPTSTVTALSGTGAGISK